MSMSKTEVQGYVYDDDHLHSPGYQDKTMRYLPPTCAGRAVPVAVTVRPLSLWLTVTTSTNSNTNSCTCR